MNTETFELFFSLLTLAALGGATALVVARVAARRSLAAHRLVAVVGAHRNSIAATIASVSTIGSLYFSEVADYVPCTLCWYQRIAMYPIAVVAIVAALRRDDVRISVSVLAVLGAGIAAYHWMIERIPDLDAGVCSATIPCDVVWFEQFGFVTLAFMALTGFLAILAVVTIPRTAISSTETSET